MQKGFIMIELAQSILISTIIVCATWIFIKYKYK